MKKILLLVFLSFSVSTAQYVQSSANKYSTEKKVMITQKDLVKVSAGNQKKILSGKLIENVSRKKLIAKKASNRVTANPKEIVAIYTKNYPSEDDLAQLTDNGIEYFLDTWTPPMVNHPFGFFLANMPVDKLDKVLSFSFIRKMDTAEYESFPQNNYGTVAIHADEVWTAGYDGTGVTVAVLDSGLDYAYDGTDIPSSYQKEDYWDYPNSTDNDVQNTVSGHGTHVTGSVLGRGTLSNGRADEGNGSDPFKGSAPDASLVFLKIGDDATSSATGAAMIGAMDAAVSTYNADIVTMSYGGWYTYHDGSSSVEQKADWVYSQGVPIFISAGNSAADAHHYSGTVNASSSTGFIEINAEASAELSFNLVWYDGTSIDNDLYLEYYDPSKTKYTTNVTQNATTESTRGTESKFSKYDLAVSADTYYLKVVNNSSNSQIFHIYFNQLSSPNVTFSNPDQEYTIGQPASADNAFAVGAWTTRATWTDYDGNSGWTFGETNGNIASFSSRGPRIDGSATKPNICAPGAAIISLRDTDVLTTADAQWVDNDGTTSAGNANYYVMQGTSMACPIAAGAAALLLDKNSSVTPAQIYSVIQDSASTSGTGAVPNSIWGYGKLDILAASNDPSLPVELVSFATQIVNDEILLKWKTATEVNNYGFDIEKSLDNNSYEKIGFVQGNGTTNSPIVYSFVDDNIPSTNEIWYRLKQIDNDGKYTYSKTISVDVSSITDIKDELNKFEFDLAQNYPNPFNPTTKISFSLPTTSEVNIKVVNVLGQTISQLVSNILPVGKHQTSWDASKFSSGVYFYQIQAVPVNGDEPFTAIRKMILAK